MNTANLQMQGLLAAVSSILQAMEQKNVLSRQEIDAALERAEMDAIRGLQHEALSDAHIEAIRFPARYLRTAQGSGTATFEETAAGVGKMKGGVVNNVGGA
jgi:hypothetical protein